jgi:hypothetical protein
MIAALALACAERHMSLFIEHTALEPEAAGDLSSRAVRLRSRVSNPVRPGGDRP